MAGKELHRGPTAETVRANVAHFRHELGLTFAELSRELERRGHSIAPLGLRRVEAGERRVDVDDLAALALALDVNPNALLFPRVEGTSVLTTVTGRPETTNANLVWAWARGRISLTGRTSDDAHSRFRYRVRPRSVMTDEERFARRESWLERRVEELRSALENADEEGTYDKVLMQEHAELLKLDPADDEAWTQQVVDPAPPQPPLTEEGPSA